MKGLRVFAESKEEVPWGKLTRLQTPSRGWQVRMAAGNLTVQ